MFFVFVFIEQCSCVRASHVLFFCCPHFSIDFAVSQQVSLSPWHVRDLHTVSMCATAFSLTVFFFDAALGAKGSHGATGRRRPARSLQGLLRGGGLDGQADKPPGGAAHGIRGMASHSIGLCRGGLHCARRLSPIRPRGLARGQRRGAERPRRSGAAAAPKERYGPAQDRL